MIKNNKTNKHDGKRRLTNNKIAIMNLLIRNVFIKRSLISLYAKKCLKST